MTSAPLHPAKFSDPILDRMRVLLTAEARRVVGRVHDGPLYVLDPFAGVGRVHQLTSRRIRTAGIEIEPEWAALHKRTYCGDMFEWIPRMVRNDDLADAIATSPTYGNRFADNHEAKDGSTRRSYTHDLGRPLTSGTSANIPWGPRYWAFHAAAYQVLLTVLRPGGLLLLNVSDFYKAKALVPATEWHRGAAMGAGFVHAGRDNRITTDRLNGHGTEATAARAEFETILRLRRPEEA